LIDPKAFLEDGVFVTALPEVSEVLSDPALGRTHLLYDTELFRKRVLTGGAVLDLSAENRGRAILICTLYLRLIGHTAEERKQRGKTTHEPRVKALMAALSRTDFILRPDIALPLFRDSITDLLKHGLFATCVKAALRGADGGEDAQTLETLQIITQFDLISALSSHEVSYRRSFVENCDGVAEAYQVLGGRSELLPAVQALRAARRSEAEITQELQNLADARIADVFSPDTEVSSVAQRSLLGAFKEMDKADRSRAFEEAFQVGEYLESHPYFETPIGKYSGAIEGLISFRDRWDQVARVLAEISKRSLTLTEPRAIMLLGHITKNGLITYTPQRTVTDRGQTRQEIDRLRPGAFSFGNPHMTFVRSIAAALPQGNPEITAQVRALSMAGKSKAVLLDAVARVDPREDEAAFVQALQTELAAARAEFAEMAARILPSPTAPQADPSPSRGLSGILKDWFKPTPRAQPARVISSMRGPRYLTNPPLRRFARAALKAQRCDLDATEDFARLDAFISYVLAESVADLPEIPAITSEADLKRLRELRDGQRGDYVSPSDVAACLQLRQHQTKIQNLTAEQRLLCRKLTMTLLPITGTSQPTRDWWNLTDAFLSLEVEEILLVFLDDFKPIYIYSQRAMDRLDHALMAGLHDEMDFAMALLWLAGRHSSRLAAPLERIATTALASDRVDKYGNIALASLAALSGGAGRDALTRLSMDLPYPSARERAAQHLATIATDPADAIAIAESIVPDHGLADGPQTVPLKLGAAKLHYLAPSDVRVTWDRPDGKEGKVPTPAMKEADPDGIADVKKLTEKVRKDLATQAAWLETLLLSERNLPLQDWRARYLGQGTLGPMVKDIVWQIVDGPAVLPDGSGFLGVDGAPLAVEGGEITLWHPGETTPDQVAAWRKLLADRDVTQPFPQVWREVYAAPPKAAEITLFDGATALQKELRQALLAEGWNGKTLSAKATEGQMILGLDATGHAAVLDLASPNAGSTGDVTLRLGALHFVKLPLGAPPDVKSIRRGKPVPAAEMPARGVSEVARHVAGAIAIKALKRWQVQSNASRPELHPGRGPGFRRLCDLIDHMIAKHGLDHVQRTDGIVTVKGGLATYTVDLVNMGIADPDTDEVITLGLKPTQIVPRLPLPHGRDDMLHRAIAIIDILSDDVNISKRATRYHQPLSRRKRRNA